jgi:prepilin-type N-terminal cleavage/methylation domain-containing protein
MKSRQAGFSLVELLVVVGIIVVLAAISVPAMSQYLRNYQIRGATQQVAGEISVARTKAIMRNVNRGALFLIRPDPNNPARFSRYQWVVPDQTLSATVPDWRPLDELIGPTSIDPGQTGPVYDLPSGLQFVQGGNASMIGFTRLGAMCDPTVSCGNPAAPVNPGTAVLCPDCVSFDAPTATATVTVLQDRDSQQRTITVLTGGRVLAQP